MPVVVSRAFIYPRLYAIHDMEPEVGTLDSVPVQPLKESNAVSGRT